MKSNQNNLENVSKSGLESRKLAISILLKTSKKNVFVNQILSTVLNKSNLSERDRRFTSALVFGVLKNQNLLDQEIKRLSRGSTDKLPPFILVLLRIAIFQLKYMTDIPDFAVLFTSAELAKKQGHIGLTRYVNGLLRNYLRQNVESENSANHDVENNIPKTSEKLAAQYSIPEWLVKRWLKHFGEIETASLLDFFHKPAELVLRTNIDSITTVDLANLLLSKGIITEVGKLVQDCLVVKSGFKGNPANLPGYADGLFLIQDEASAFAAFALSPKEDDWVVDLCAAPGSKTIYLAQQMKKRGHIIAVDKSQKRFEYLQTKSDQLNLKNIEMKVANACLVVLERQADKVLLDAPCLGTGVLHRRQDLRHKRQSGDLQSLISLQRELLENASKLVRPGGALVYSTCSMEPEENIENIVWFLKNHPEFSGDDLTPFIPELTLKNWQQKLSTLQGEETAEQRIFMINLKQGILQLLPFRHGLSGFFICRMLKQKLN